MTTPNGQSPLDDFRALALAPAPDHSEALVAAHARESHLAKPPGSLGRLEEIVEWLAVVTGRAPPQVRNPRVVVFAAANGVAAEAVSAYPAEVNPLMLEAFRANKAAINQLCTAAGVGLSVFDLAVTVPSGNIRKEDAFASEKELAGTLAFGLEATANGVDLLGLGEMGIANTTVAAALFAALFGGTGTDWAGPGTGVTGDALSHKAAVIDDALARVSGTTDPLALLQRLGGREVAAMTGAILAARSQAIPVVIDGFVATAAAAVVYAIEPKAIEHCLFAHLSAEPGHRRALEAMGVEPLLDLRMRLGEGSGAAVALPIIRAAALTHSGMATLEQLGAAHPS